MFLVLEGIDGSGKSEQTRRLAAWLRGLGHEVVATREPTDGEWGRRYRRWAAGEVDASAEEVLDFFVEDRLEHVAGLIEPTLARGAIVVCDRYVGSTLAYQAAHGVDRALLERECDPARFPAPDLVLWLRLPVAQAIARMGASATERYERADVLEAVDREYERLGYEPIDASGSEDEVERRLRDRVAAVLER